ncbi:MAG TPA: DUF2442 domain-containing protein [Rhodothermales bacterium]|nr:DUF2442 domain-containing protein [Rhodothermales bacterium]
MSTAANKQRPTGTKPPPPSAYGDPTFVRLEVTDDLITAYLSDGRVVSVPLWWSPTLSRASAEQRGSWRIIGAGRVAEWEDLDEHISVGSFFHGSPAPGACNPEYAE